jgi:hypothetical protein
MNKLVSLSVISVITAMSFNAMADESKSDKAIEKVATFKVAVAETDKKSIFKATEKEYNKPFFNIEEYKDGQIIAKVSTMGTGIEYVSPVSPELNVSFGINRLNKSDSMVEDGIDYKAEVDFNSLSVIANYHHWQNGFRLRSGIYYNNNEIKLNADYTAASGEVIGNKEFGGAKINIDGKLSFEKISPYVGIGYGSEPFGDNNLSLDIDLGIMRSPVTVKLTGTCSAEDTSEGNVCEVHDFDTELANEQENLAESLDGIDFYPVISLGVSYRF